MQKAIFVPQKSVATAFILALLRGLGEVGITLILGGNIIGKTDTISLSSHLPPITQSMTAETIRHSL